VHFVGGEIELGGVNVTADIRSERMGLMASKVAALPLVRTALLQRQRDFLTAQGLVADGRDMGSVVFPNAALKVFLTASAEARAERRFKQLKEKGDSVIFADVLLNMEQRDTQDKARSMAPLRQFDDAFLLDTSQLSIEQAVEQVISWFRQIG
jgi:cytidylate kinase